MAKCRLFEFPPGVTTEMSRPLSASWIFTSPLLTLLHPRRRSGCAKGSTSWEVRSRGSCGEHLLGRGLQLCCRGRGGIVLARGVIQLARGVLSRDVAEVGAMRGIGEHSAVKRLLFEKSARLTDQRQQQKQSREARLCRWHSRSRTLRKSRGIGPPRKICYSSCFFLFELFKIGHDLVLSA